MYKTKLSLTPPSIACDNNKITIQEVLQVDVASESSLHLRIPKKNKRPEDVLLASGYKS